MTCEEAIKQLKDEIHEAIPKSAITARKHNEAVGMAIEALEKQIPKKPTMWGNGYVDGELIMESYECPNCACIYDFDIDGKLKFCSECGQAIDWSDT